MRKVVVCPHCGMKLSDLDGAEFCDEIKEDDGTMYIAYNMNCPGCAGFFRFFENYGFRGYDTEKFEE